MPSLASHLRTKEIAKSWLAVLNTLEIGLSDAHIKYLADASAKRSSDAVPRDVTLNSREYLLGEIKMAKDFFKSFPM